MEPKSFSDLVDKRARRSRGGKKSHSADMSKSPEIASIPIVSSPTSPFEWMGSLSPVVADRLESYIENEVRRRVREENQRHIRVLTDCINELNDEIDKMREERDIHLLTIEELDKNCKELADKKLHFKLKCQKAITKYQYYKNNYFSCKATLDEMIEADRISTPSPVPSVKSDDTDAQLDKSLSYKDLSRAKSRGRLMAYLDNLPDPNMDIPSPIVAEDFTSSSYLSKEDEEQGEAGDGDRYTEENPVLQLSVGLFKKPKTLIDSSSAAVAKTVKVIIHENSTIRELKKRIAPIFDVKVESILLGKIKRISSLSGRKNTIYQFHSLNEDHKTLVECDLSTFDVIRVKIVQPAPVGKSEGVQQQPQPQHKTRRSLDLTNDEKKDDNDDNDDDNYDGVKIDSIVVGTDRKPRRQRGLSKVLGVPDPLSMPLTLRRERTSSAPRLDRQT